MAYRFSVGCCCDKEIKTCEELIEAGGPFPNVTWGDAATVMDDCKSQTGADNQYGFLWLCSSIPDLYVQRTDANVTSSYSVAFTTQQYRTFFKDGLSEVRANGNLLAYYVSYNIHHYADESVESLISQGYTVYGTWTKCSDKRQSFWINLSKVTPDRYTVSATADKYEIEITSIDLDGYGRDRIPRQDGETDSEWITRALAEYNHIYTHYRVYVYYYMDLTVNRSDFSQYVQDAVVYKQWMYIAFSQYRIARPYREWYTLSDDGVWSKGLYQWYDMTDDEVNASRRYVRHSNDYVASLVSSDNYETFKTISEEQGESYLESSYYDLMDEESFIVPSVQEFILYND